MNEVEEKHALNEALQQKIRHSGMESRDTACGLQGAIGSNMAGYAVRPTLRDRVGMQTDEARRQSRKADLLEELAYLLDKNPDIARILDLLEDVRG